MPAERPLKAEWRRWRGAPTSESFHLISSTVWVGGVCSLLGLFCLWCKKKRLCSYHPVTIALLCWTCCWVDLFIGFSVQPFVMYSWSVFLVCFGPLVPVGESCCADAREWEPVWIELNNLKSRWAIRGCVLTDGCVLMALLLVVICSLQAYHFLSSGWISGIRMWIVESHCALVIPNQGPYTTVRQAQFLAKTKKKSSTNFSRAILDRHQRFTHVS